MSKEKVKYIFLKMYRHEYDALHYLNDHLDEPCAALESILLIMDDYFEPLNEDE